MAQAALVVLCDICETDQKVKFYCVDCEENMCTNCKIYHSKSKKTKNDKVILITEAREENITKTPLILCAEHSKEEVMIYCEKCDQLICTECLIGKHKGHNLASLKQMKITATDQLVNLRKKLRDRKLSYEETLIGEGKVHTEYIATIKQCRDNISDQKEKIVEEVNVICDEEFTELTFLEENEIKRYSDTCTNIQKQQQIVTTALQTIQNVIDSGHPVSMLQAKKDVIKSIGGLDNLTPAQLDLPEFQRVPLEVQALRQHLGSVHKKSGGARLKQVTTEASKQKSDVKTSQEPNINKNTVNEVRIKSILFVKGKTTCIKVIIPTKNNCIWVSSVTDKYLTLISDKGDTIKTSVTVDGWIEDAKAYNNDILVTCEGGEQVFRLSGEGTIKSVFSNLHPYYALGLCVTNEMDVLVCLGLKSGSDNKVVRIGKNGKIIQIIQKDSRGHPLYSWPYRVTAAPSGEIFVTQANNGKVTCVDRDGQHLFTWTGEVDGKQTDKCGTYGIAQDNHNIFVTDFTNCRVYALRKDGTGAKCLLDYTRTQEIFGILGLALGDCGQLLVGSHGGMIHAVDHLQSLHTQ